MAFEYSYSFTEKAMRDFDEILHYISVELANPTSAKILGKKIFEKIDNVRSFPESGALVDNEFLTDKTVRKLLVENFIVYYKANHDEKNITVIRIIYAKRNLDEILRNI